MTRTAWLFGVCLVSVAAALPLAQGPAAPAAPEVTFTKHIAPILQRSCENCHRPDGVAPMSLRTYEEVRPWARVDQAAHRPRPARRRDAALVCREEHRHPEVQERSVAQRRRDRDDREVGRQRRAARQPRRHAAAAHAGPPTNTWAIGEPDLVVRTKDVVVKGTAPDWWGEIPRVPTGPDRGSLRLGARDPRSQRRDRRRHRPRDRRRTLRVPPHDLEHARARRGCRRSARARTTAPRGRCTKSDVKRISSTPVGAPAQGRVEHRLRLGAPALERPRHHRAPRDRLQVHAEGLQA